jgi:hypothetical protein
MATTPEEEEIIKKRFLTQTTVTRGEPPLKRLAQRCRSRSGALSRWLRHACLPGTHDTDDDLLSKPFYAACHDRCVSQRRPAVEHEGLPDACAGRRPMLPGVSPSNFLAPVPLQVPAVQRGRDAGQRRAGSGAPGGAVPGLGSDPGALVSSTCRRPSVLNAADAGGPQAVQPRWLCNMRSQGMSILQLLAFCGRRQLVEAA